VPQFFSSQNSPTARILLERARWKRGACEKTLQDEYYISVMEGFNVNVTIQPLNRQDHCETLSCKKLGVSWHSELVPT